MIDVGSAEVAANDIVDEDEILAPDRLIQSEGDRRLANIFRRGPSRC